MAYLAFLVLVRHLPCLSFSCFYFKAWHQLNATAAAAVAVSFAAAVVLLNCVTMAVLPLLRPVPWPPPAEAWQPAEVGQA